VEIAGVFCLNLDNEENRIKFEHNVALLNFHDAVQLANSARKAAAT